MSNELLQFEPSRAAALTRLAAFVPLAGWAYARNRNEDLLDGQPAGVSLLSPYLRRRVLTETEVLAAVLAEHGAAASEKFVQEVFWRTYWKGWLEQHPEVWARYCDELNTLTAQLNGASYRAAYQQAREGRTGIECFDHWARQLVEFGFVHNHARMWFASIWIFTLKLPWQLGADFFLSHLLDADPASNTLSWRWVAGLQTKGKTYLARASNIAQYTRGRFEPQGLASHAPALTESPFERESTVASATVPQLPATDFVLLLHGEDLHLDEVNFGQHRPRLVVQLAVPANGVFGRRSAHAAQFVASLESEALPRNALAQKCGTEQVNHQAVDETADRLAESCQRQGTKEVVAMRAAIGEVADVLRPLVRALAVRNIQLSLVDRPLDRYAWPRATKGFFQFKEAIPKLLGQLGIGENGTAKRGVPT